MLVPALLLSPVANAVTSTRLVDSTREVTLDNGMKLLMVQRPGQPSIAAGWVAHVGSANEQPGITGISHLFEHMMFKGSSRIGTRNARLDDRLRDQLDEIRDQMFAEERVFRDQVRQGYAEAIDDEAIQTETMEALKTRFQSLIDEQRENLIKDEFDKIYTEAGASGMNAFTNTDMTVYFIRMPRNKLELWFWMESERLLQPVFREFYSERDVVFEERRMRTDSTPTGAHDEVFNAMFWRGHPYAWPTVGWPSDIAAITRQQAEDYFDLYYAPGNITLALVGDFDEDQAIEWANDYFGRIPAGKRQPPDVITLGMPLLGDITYQAEVDAPPSAQVMWQGSAYAGKDDPALQVLASVLSGKTGRLYKRLVLKDKIATSAGAGAGSNKYDGSFSVSASGKQGVEPEQLRQAMIEEVELIAAEGISDYELTKVKNGLVAAKFRRLEDPFFLMVQLLYYDGLRDWRTMDSYMERILKVDADQVQQAAASYLTEEGRASLLYRRKMSDQPVDPELAALPEEQQARVGQMLSQMGAAPAEQLVQVIAAMEANRAAAPAEVHAMLDYLLKQLRSRLEEKQQ
jgi:predicted Zn-dependent peptidase